MQQPQLPWVLDWLAVELLLLLSVLLCEQQPLLSVLLCEPQLTAAIFGLPPHFCAVPLAAPEPQWGGYWGQGRRVRAKIRPPSSRKQLAGHCRAAAAR